MAAVVHCKVQTGLRVAQAVVLAQMAEPEVQQLKETPVEEPAMEMPVAQESMQQHQAVAVVLVVLVQALIHLTAVLD